MEIWAWTIKLNSLGVGLRAHGQGQECGDCGRREWVEVEEGLGG